ncbi:unnamed protein product [Amoebophrya sp. A25]|nr:unnamed protein product [Amoebophrya sp. A25]|eukprot:GSA25T00025680001.1
MSCLTICFLQLLLFTTFGYGVNLRSFLSASGPSSPSASSSSTSTSSASPSSPRSTSPSSRPSRRPPRPSILNQIRSCATGVASKVGNAKIPPDLRESQLYRLVLLNEAVREHLSGCGEETTDEATYLQGTEEEVCSFCLSCRPPKTERRCGNEYETQWVLFPLCGHRFHTECVAKYVDRTHLYDRESDTDGTGTQTAPTGTAGTRIRRGGRRKRLTCPIGRCHVPCVTEGVRGMLPSPSISKVREKIMQLQQEGEDSEKSRTTKCASCTAGTSSSSSGACTASFTSACACSAKNDNNFIEAALQELDTLVEQWTPDDNTSANGAHNSTSFTNKPAVREGATARATTTSSIATSTNMKHWIKKAIFETTKGILQYLTETHALDCALSAIDTQILQSPDLLCRFLQEQSELPKEERLRVYPSYGLQGSFFDYHNDLASHNATDNNGNERGDHDGGGSISSISITESEELDDDDIIDSDSRRTPTSNEPEDVEEMESETRDDAADVDPPHQGEGHFFEGDLEEDLFYEESDLLLAEAMNRLQLSGGHDEDGDPEEDRVGASRAAGSGFEGGTSSINGEDVLPDLHEVFLTPGENPFQLQAGDTMEELVELVQINGLVPQNTPVDEAVVELLQADEEQDDDASEHAGQLETDGVEFLHSMEERLAFVEFVLRVIKAAPISKLLVCMVDLGCSRLLRTTATDALNATTSAATVSCSLSPSSTSPMNKLMSNVTSQHDVQLPPLPFMDHDCASSATSLSSTTSSLLTPILVAAQNSLCAPPSLPDSARFGLRIAFMLGLTLYPFETVIREWLQKKGYWYCMNKGKEEEDEEDVAQGESPSSRSPSSAASTSASSQESSSSPTTTFSARTTTALSSSRRKNSQQISNDPCWSTKKRRVFLIVILARARFKVAMLLEKMLRRLQQWTHPEVPRMRQGLREFLLAHKENLQKGK